MHNHGDLLRTMDLIAPTGLPFMIHPHDQALMDYIEGEILARGENTPQALRAGVRRARGRHLGHRDRLLLRLAEASGCHVHLMHMQTRRSIDAVRRAKARGIKVTCEINHWSLFLGSWDDVEKLGPYALSYWNPDDAKAAVWEGLLDGTIDMMSSDHAPHTREEKEVGWTKMWSAHTGTPGIQYQLPLLLDLVNKGKLTLERAIEAVCSRPAEVFGLGADEGRHHARRRRRPRRRRPRQPVDDHERQRALALRLDAVRRPRVQRQHRAHAPARPGHLRRRQGHRAARPRAHGASPKTPWLRQPERRHDD